MKEPLLMVILYSGRDAAWSPIGHNYRLAEAKQVVHDLRMQGGPAYFFKQRMGRHRTDDVNDCPACQIDFHRVVKTATKKAREPEVFL